MAARLAKLLPRLNERDRRLALATEARSWGYGGIVAVHEATGASKTTISRGIRELESDADALPAGRVRAAGGGRKRPRSPTPNCWTAWTASSNRERGETRSRRCGGRRSRPGTSPA